MYLKKHYHTGFNKTALYVWGRSVVKYLGSLTLSAAKVKVIVQVTKLSKLNQTFTVWGREPSLRLRSRSLCRCLGFRVLV